MGRKQRFARAWHITRRNWFWEAVRAVIVGVSAYYVLASSSDEGTARLMDAVGPAGIALLIAVLVFLGEFGVNYARAGDQLALEDERAAHLHTREELAESQRRLGSELGEGADSGSAEIPLWELVAAAEARTELEFGRMVEPHLGASVALTGVVNDVSSLTLGTVILFIGGIEGAPPGAICACWFNAEEWQARLEMLRKGDGITVRGALQRVTETGVSLEECELQRA